MEAESFILERLNYEKCWSKRKIFHKHIQLHYFGLFITLYAISTLVFTHSLVENVKSLLNKFRCLFCWLSILQLIELFHFPKSQHTFEFGALSFKFMAIWLDDDELCMLLIYRASHRFLRLQIAFLFNFDLIKFSLATSAIFFWWQQHLTRTPQNWKLVWVVKVFHTYWYKNCHVV